MLPSPLHLQTSDAPAGLHSFPTRRSSDLWLDQQLRDAAPYIDDDGFTARVLQKLPAPGRQRQDRKSTRLNSSHRTSSYAVFCWKKKKRVGISNTCLAVLRHLVVTDAEQRN